MSKFEKIRSKVSSALETLIGILLAICLFIGALGFFGYIAAFITGGETAQEICTFVYKTFYGTLIKISTVTTIICFALIYIRGDAKWKNPFKRPHFEDTRK